MNIQEYLKQCSVKSVDELSDEQLLAYYNESDVYIGQRCSVLLAVRDCEKYAVSKALIFQSIRKALKTGQDFKFYYVDNESANGSVNNKARWVVEP